MCFALQSADATECQNSSDAANADVSSSKIQPASKSECNGLPAEENFVPSSKPAAVIVPRKVFAKLRRLNDMSTHLAQLLNSFAIKIDNANNVDNAAAPSGCQGAAQNLPLAFLTDVGVSAGLDDDLCEIAQGFFTYSDGRDEDLRATAEALFPHIMKLVLELQKCIESFPSYSKHKPQTSDRDNGHDDPNSSPPDVVNSNTDADLPLQHYSDSHGSSEEAAAAESLNAHCQNTAVTSALKLLLATGQPSGTELASTAPEFAAQGKLMPD